MDNSKSTSTKKISQLYIEHENGQPPEVVDIVLPLDQVVLAGGGENGEDEKLSSLISWGNF